MLDVFRGVFPAASLKDLPERAIATGIQSAVFRGVFPAASLKGQPRLLSASAAAVRFPRGIPRGLIEGGRGRATRP